MKSLIMYLQSVLGRLGFESGRRPERSGMGRIRDTTARNDGETTVAQGTAVRRSAQIFVQIVGSRRVQT